jgi:hypothetical protein
VDFQLLARIPAENYLVLGLQDFPIAFFPWLTQLKLITKQTFYIFKIEAKLMNFRQCISKRSVNRTGAVQSEI